MPSRDWTRAEVEAAVADYLDMLAREVRGERFNKAEHNRALQERLDGRSKGAVEFKHQNISAVLIAEGFPYIDGYKPRRNLQAELRRAVRERLPEIERLIRADVEKRQELRSRSRTSWASKSSPPSPGEPAVGERRSDYLTPRNGRRPRRLPAPRSPEPLTGRRGRGARDGLRTRASRTRRQGPPRPERRAGVEDPKGDHMGFDIRSYEASGRDRFIEVKTTRYGRHTPFYISDGELRFSEEHAESYHLYRLFGFRKRPLLFTLPGDVSEHVQLHPVNYRAQL